MTEKFNILGKYIKDISSETKDIETYIFVKNRIPYSSFSLSIFFPWVSNSLFCIRRIVPKFGAPSIE